jgi:Tfp pilus assembly protein PilF
MRRGAHWLFLLVCLQVAAPAAAQRTSAPSAGVARTFVITGQVRFSDTGMPVEMVKVDLVRFTGETIATAFTRSNGDFEFAGLTRGGYVISVMHDDCEPLQERVEIVNGDRRGVFVYLVRKASAGPQPAGSTVSARELALPPRARAAFDKGTQRLYKKKDAQGSLAHFLRVIEISPDFYEAHYQLGVGYLRLNQQAEAESAFRKAIELSGDSYAEPYFGLASVLCHLKKFRECEAAARRGLEILPNAWDGHYHLALSQMGMNRLDEAEKNLRLVTVMRPNFSEQYLVYANLYIRRKDYPQLLRTLDTYLDLEPEGPASENVRQMREVVKRAVAEQQKNAKAGPGGG